MIKNLKQIFSDLLHIHRKQKNIPEYGFAFLVHPRDDRDVFKKFPFFKYLPNHFIEVFTKNFWPITLSKITGLRDYDSDKEIPGWVISIPLTAKQMMENRDLALKHIIKAATLAKNKGAKLIGLGALTSSMSKGGLELTNRVDIGVTTGHAYTAFTVTETLLSIMKDLDCSFEDSTLAIVGASGSVGSASTRILIKNNFKKIILIDLDRKMERLKKELKNYINDNIKNKLILSHQIKDVKKADFIITATNAPEALIKSEDLKTGAVVVDDAQPSDIDDSVFNREDVLILEAGAVHTPGISANFKMGLKNKYDNFCCLAEVLILAAEKKEGDFVIGKTTDKQIEYISSKGRILGFHISDYQNINGIIRKSRIQEIKKIKNKNIHNANQF